MLTVVRRKKNAFFLVLRPISNTSSITQFFYVFLQLIVHSTLLHYNIDFQRLFQMALNPPNKVSSLSKRISNFKGIINQSPNDSFRLIRAAISRAFANCPFVVICVADKPKPSYVLHCADCCDNNKLSTQIIS